VTFVHFWCVAGAGGGFFKEAANVWKRKASPRGSCIWFVLVLAASRDKMTTPGAAVQVSGMMGGLRVDADEDFGAC